MEKEVKLFDPKFVHFMWDDSLEGKEGLFADRIKDLEFCVETNSNDCYTGTCFNGNDKNIPFKKTIKKNNVGDYVFFYYDPNYEAKRAYYKEGKKVQAKKIDSFVDWVDCDEPLWSKDCEYRVKPEEEKWIAYLARYRDGLTLCCCDESYWVFAKKFDGAKTKLFVGTREKCVEWIHARKKFVEVIKAWEDGKTIQYRETSLNRWIDCDPLWYVETEYRVKPECPCEDGIDSKACAGCSQDEERKQTFRPFKDCDELVEFWSKNYQTGFRPAYTKPLIWVRLKCDGRERLIVAFGKGFVTDFVEIGNEAKAVPLQKLFDDYEFLDGSPVGKKEER